MGKVKVILWGLGSMGGGMAKALLKKRGVEIVGAIGQNPAKIGNDLGEVLGHENIGIKISAEAADVLSLSADIVLHSTQSFTKTVFPQIKQIVESGKNVITIAEEMAAPQAQNRELAEQLDALARNHGVSILGTGINPGFILDTLIVALTGACMEVNSIKAARVNDLSPFGPTVMKTQGVGATPEEFVAGLGDGSIVGHIGFKESIFLIANAIGWELDRVEETREPIISSVYRETPHVKVQPGMVAGCRHIARGYKNGEEIITLEHPQQIHPELEGVETGDYIWIKGTPDINFANKPEIPGGIGTMAVAVNMIPQVINARPGLLTMMELPVPAAMMGDVRQLIGKC
jgi:4-hydroxy-tetrahydrodipicolinate reductase